MISIFFQKKKKVLQLIFKNHQFATAPFYLEFSLSESLVYKKRVLNTC